MLGVTSPGILRLPFLAVFLGEEAVRAGRLSSARRFRAIAGWGRRPSAARARALARRNGIGFVALEDGFLRSFGTGENFPPLSLVVDDLGIYYDSTCASALEILLNSATDVLEGITGEVARARALLLKHRLSKYNHAPVVDLETFVHPDPHPPPEAEGIRQDRGAEAAAERLSGSIVQRVLVVDQTAGDMSVALGGASAETFAAMLAAARTENPQAVLYVKTHPEVGSGRKGGYLTQVQDDAHTVVLREHINPLSLIEQMDRVYVVSSTMGFEALLAGKPVTVFGMPWYAGWGATDDRQRCARRTRERSVDELFAAAYFHYTRYLNPATHQRGTIFDVIDWLVRQREMAFAGNACA
jgi:capsular polysaccharide export protein